MLITLGACGASLVWLAIWPALTRRTERLARRRIEAGLPMSVAEFAAERDQLRALLLRAVGGQPKVIDGEPEEDDT